MSPVPQSSPNTVNGDPSLGSVRSAVTGPESRSRMLPIPVRSSTSARMPYSPLPEPAGYTVPSSGSGPMSGSGGPPAASISVNPVTRVCGRGLSVTVNVAVVSGSASPPPPASVNGRAVSV